MKAKPNPRLYMGLAVLTLVGGSAASYYQYSAFTDQNDVVEKLRVDTRPEDKIQVEVEQSNQKLEACLDQLRHLEQGVPQFAYVPTMLNELEQLGNSTGIEVLGVRPVAVQKSPKDEKAKKEKSPYQELEIEVKGRGEYANVLRFVSALQAFPKIVEARTVALTPKNEVGRVGAPRLEVEVHLRAFVFPPPRNPIEAASQATPPAVADEAAKEVPTDGR
ncbi:MAG: type 4a pilus biogenesis protein PilO [Fimbriimonadaceae bacterium]|nr:type 4a pilus biogenesis protein PilO [Fimbriimonadaceae bacterium]